MVMILYARLSMTLAASCVLGTVVGCTQPAIDTSDVTATSSIVTKSDTSQSDAPQAGQAPKFVESEGLPASEPVQAALTPGRYCYQLEDETITANIRLTLDADDQIIGDTQATIHDEEAGYYSAYIQKFTGTRTDNQSQINPAQINITTWIEYDVQESEETWMLGADTLETERLALTTADCAVVSQAFQDDAGLEASDLLSGITFHTQSVQFEPGASSATVSNSVIRGERDVYQLGAEGGQLMTLQVEALEDNAVFDVLSPSGLILEREATIAELLLPHTGDYQVIVGGTRGNASYTLTIGIE